LRGSGEWHEEKELSTVKAVFRPIAKEYLRGGALTKSDWIEKSGFKNKKRSFYKHFNRAMELGYLKSLVHPTGSVQLSAMARGKAMEYAALQGWKIIGPSRPLDRKKWEAMNLPQEWGVYSIPQLEALPAEVGPFIPVFGDYKPIIEFLNRLHYKDSRPSQGNIHKWLVARLERGKLYNKKEAIKVWDQVRENQFLKMTAKGFSWYHKLDRDWIRNLPRPL